MIFGNFLIDFHFIITVIVIVVLTVSVVLFGAFGSFLSPQPLGGLRLSAGGRAVCLPLLAS